MADRDRLRQVIGASGVAALVLVAARAGAEPTADEREADRLFTEANALVASKHYADACPKFAASDRLDPALGTKYNLADCLEHTGRPASAWSLFLRVSAAAREAGKGDRERDSRERARALESKLPRLTIRVSEPAPDVTVKRDGAMVPESEIGAAIPVDPGDHVVEAEAPERTPFRAVVKVDKEGARGEITIPALARASADAPAPPPSGGGTTTLPSEDDRGRGDTQRWIGLSLVGLGAVGVVVGSVFGASSISKHHDAASGPCPNAGPCADPAAVDQWKSAASAGNVSTVAFVVGGAALAGGAVLWLTAPKAASSIRASGARKSYSSSSAGVRAAPAFGAGYGGISLGGAF